MERDRVRPVHVRTGILGRGREARAAEKPSTLSLMLPEAWLHTARADGADGRIAGTMRRYLAEGVFQTVPDSFIYVERTLSDGRVRRGLVAALDLEQYDFTERSVRASAPRRAR